MNASTDLDVQNDSSVISEIESTTPNAASLQAKIDETDPVSFVIATRKDGTQVCDAVYIDEEGGYAYRLRDLTSNVKSSWDFARTGDFTKNYESFSVHDADTFMSSINRLASQVVALRKSTRKMYAAMGSKSRSRLGRELTDSLFGDKKSS